MGKVAMRFDSNINTRSDVRIAQYSPLHKILLFFIFFGRIDGALYESDIAFLLTILAGGFGFFYICIQPLKSQVKFSYNYWQGAYLLLSGFSILWAYSQPVAKTFIIALLGRFILLMYIWAFLVRTHDLVYLIKCFVVSTLITNIHMFMAVGLRTLLLSRATEDATLVSQAWNANVIALNNVFTLFLIWSIIIPTSNSANKKFYFIICLIAIIMTLICGSKKSLIVLVAMLSLLYFGKQKRKIIPALKVTLVVSIVLLLIMKIPVLYSIIGHRFESLFEGIFTDQNTLSKSDRTRQTLMKWAWEDFKKRKLLGYGIGNFKAVHDIELYSHSNYLEVLTGTGIIGAAIYYIGYLYIILKSIVKRRTYLAIVSLAGIIPLLLCDYIMVSYLVFQYQFFIIVLLYLCQSTFYKPDLEEKNNVII